MKKNLTTLREKFKFLYKKTNVEFKPQKNHYYVYFNFYDDTIKYVEVFSKELKEMYPFILGFVNNSKENSNCYNLLVYVSSQAECNNMKNDNTLKLYNKYINSIGEGYNVF